MARAAQYKYTMGAAQCLVVGSGAHNGNGRVDSGRERARQETGAAAAARAIATTAALADTGRGARESAGGGVTHVVLDVGVCATLEQELRDLDIAILRRPMEWSPALLWDGQV